MRRYIGPSELNGRVNYNDPYSYEMNFSLTGNTASDSEYFVTGMEDFWATEILVDVKDNYGVSLVDGGAADSILFTIKTEDGEDLVHSDGITLTNLNKLISSYRYKGMVLEHKQKVTVKVWAATFPASAVRTFPVNIHISFLGYRLIPSKVV